MYTLLLINSLHGHFNECDDRKQGLPVDFTYWYNLLRKNEEGLLIMEVMSYLFFGVMTTIVNIVIYFLCRDILQFHFAVANTISWILSVLFAFVTNKKWVFHSKSETKAEWIEEAVKFIFYRGLSYVLDMASMFILLKILLTSDVFAKFLTQILVVVANYFFSKLLIFNNKKK